MEFERFFEASPERVFGALLSELKDSGQLEAVGEFGSSATFKIAHTPLHPAPTLLAQVRAGDSSTVLRVQESRNGQWRSLHDDHHLLHLTHLLARVGERLGRAGPCDLGVSIAGRACSVPGPAKWPRQGPVRP